MGDFEDVFGAGADLDRIIDRYSRASLRGGEDGEKPRVPATVAAYDVDAAPPAPDDAPAQWRRAMRARGYEEGPTFTTYADLAAWEKTNTRPHVRMRFAVFFTDAAIYKQEVEGFPGTLHWEGEIPF